LMGENIQAVGCFSWGVGTHCRALLLGKGHFRFRRAWMVVWVRNLGAQGLGDPPSAVFLVRQDSMNRAQGAGRDLPHCRKPTPNFGGFYPRL